LTTKSKTGDQADIRKLEAGWWLTVTKDDPKQSLAGLGIQAQRADGHKKPRVSGVFLTIS
jgi:hypothetical protein